MKNLSREDRAEVLAERHRQYSSREISEPVYRVSLSILKESRRDIDCHVALNRPKPIVCRYTEDIKSQSEQWLKNRLS